MTERGRKDKQEAGGFLSRWSARKRGQIGEEAQEGQEASAAPSQAGIATGEPVPGDPEAAETELDEEAQANREAAEAVDIDELQYESDYAVFFRRGVPDMLRRRALRKLWTSHPVLANVDGLNDYDEDFADPALNVFRSTWQVGRGFLTDEDQQAGEGPQAAESKARVSSAQEEKAGETGRADASEEVVADGGDAGLPEVGPEDQKEVAIAPMTAADSSPSEEQATKADIEEGNEEGGAEEAQPARVSLRSRLFE